MNEKLLLINGTANGGFQPDELVNASALTQGIVSSDKPLALHLRERFARAQLAPPPESATTAELEKYKAAVLEELNRIIGGDPLYTDARFASVKLSTYTRMLLGKNPVGTGLVRLNKLLLLDALPEHFRRKPGRGKNMVQKPATVHQLKTGKWGIFVTLVEPRELEGKMRSDRQKFERQTESEANDLCIDINAKLFNKELARQLTAAEIAIAKKLLWELLEPKHPDWIDHTSKIVEHCEKTGFRVDQDKNTSNIMEAAKLFWEEHVRGLEPESRMNYRNALAYLLPAFGKLKPFEMTDSMVLLMAFGKEPLAFLKTSWKKKQTPEEAEKRFWDTPIQSKSKRPWTHFMKVRFLQCAKKFKDWMHASKDPVTQEKRDWCPASEITIPDPPKEVTGKAGDDEESDEVMDAQCRKHPALTIPQAQALLDVCHIAFDGTHAAFYCHGFFGGSRVKETKQMGVKGFDPDDGVQAMSSEAAKKDEARESTLYTNLIIMVEALRSAGLYTNEALRPNGQERTVIHILAGFTSNSKQAHIRANRERKRLAALGIVLPQYHWGIPFPKNALRRTSLSMHYKLFKSVALTVEWAGNSGDVFRPFYKRLVTNADARQYWVMLPKHLTAAGVKVNLPANHKLDSAMTSELATKVSTACEAAKQAAMKLGEVKAKAADARPAELKARQAVYNKRAYLKRKARELAAEQQHESQPGDGTQPAGNAS